MPPVRTRPHLKRREVVVDEEGQTSDRDHQELHPERVVVSVICGLELGVDHVDRGVGTSDVDELERKGLRYKRH